MAIKKTVNIQVLRFDFILLGEELQIETANCLQDELQTISENSNVKYSNLAMGGIMLAGFYCIYLVGSNHFCNKPSSSRSTIQNDEEKSEMPPLTAKPVFSKFSSNSNSMFNRHSTDESLEKNSIPLREIKSVKL